jgi:hypothetical protein
MIHLLYSSVQIVNIPIYSPNQATNGHVKEDVGWESIITVIQDAGFYIS